MTPPGAPVAARGGSIPSAGTEGGKLSALFAGERALHARTFPPADGRGMMRAEVRMGAPRIGLVILAVEDLARAARFVREAFGWTATVEVPVYVEWELPGGFRFGVYERGAYGRNPGAEAWLPPAGALQGTELYLYADDLPAACERVVAAGARPLSPLAPRGWGDEVAYFAAPDGWLLALARPLP
jgi:predicted enzyme related to lactoylglutathione lyase